MLKFKYLSHNIELTKLILKNWKHDEDRVDDWLQHFRISENAVYPYPYKNQTFILRFAPVAEKSKQQLEATLEFLDYLYRNGMQVMHPVRSKRGNIIEHVISPWGEYYATSYEKVEGERLDQAEYSREMMFTYGKTLGELHRLSQNFTPNTPYRTHEDILRWIEKILYSHRAPKSAIDELYLLSHYFNHLSRHDDNYGLIHFDFQMDNVFYDIATDTCNIIDFDDCMYHWFCMDIVNVMDDLKKNYSPELFLKAKDVFLHGYRTIRNLPHSYFRHEKIFKRFCDLYKYTRILYAMNEIEPEEPEWMQNLRRKLSIIMSSLEQAFGTEILE